MIKKSKKLDIDFLYLDLNTCKRCMATDTSLNDALAVLSSLFYILGYSTNINKVSIQKSEQAEQYHFLSSPTILVNGVDILGEIEENDCKDCGDLCGDTVDCRVFTYEGQEYQQPPTAMIVDGILRVLYGNLTSEDMPYVIPNNLKNYFSRRNAIMKKMSIYEPAMCCDTGVCGVSVDPELLRISTVLNSLKKNGVGVDRFNLSNAPMAFVNNQIINKYVIDKGPKGLPAVMIDDEIIITGRYPTNAEFVSLLGVPESYLTETKTPQKSGGCGCSNDKCC